MVKAFFVKLLTRLWEGFRRFGSAYVCALVVSVLFVLMNHDVVDDTVGIRLVCGIYWGALAGVFTQLLLEWRKVSIRQLPVVLVTLAVGSLGCWFWFSFGEDSPRYCLWMMLYIGFIISMLASCIAVLYCISSQPSLFLRVVFTAIGSVGSATLLTLSFFLCIFAFDQLVTSVDSSLTGDVAGLVYPLATTISFLAFLPKGGDDEEGSHESQRAARALFWLFLPASLILLAILYIYLGRIVQAWSMPSGKLNWFGSVALLVYIFFWLTLRDSTQRFFRFVVRWGWALILPVVIAQIVGVVIRYRAYGMTTPRVLGMVALLIGLVALVLAALNHHPRRLFVFIALVGLVFTVSPLNIVDIPIFNQEYRLRSALERNGLIKDGKLALNPDVKIAPQDAEIIVGSLTYLSPRVGWGRDSDSWFDNGSRMEPHIWHRPAFAEEVLNAAAEVCRTQGYAKGDLFSAFGISPQACKNAPKRGLYMPREKAWFSAPREFPIAGASRLCLLDGLSLTCVRKGDRWFLTVPVSSVAGFPSPVDVTDSIVRIFKTVDWNGVLDETVTFKLKSEDAQVELRPGWTLVLDELWVSGQKGEEAKKVHFGRTCAILIRETP